MSSNDPRVQALYQISIPTVFLDSMFHGDYATWVRSDYLDGSRQAVEYLLSLGHRRMAFFHGEGAKDVERLLGWHQALARVGLTPDPQLIRLSSWHMESAYQAARELLEERRDFTAIIAGSDMMAFGILRALHAHGLRVPEDVSLIGFDDINYSEISIPPLTTVRQDTQKLSQEAISRLLHMIETGETPDPLIVPTQLIIRGSASSILHSAEFR
jgi:LacI family transcriptional regulator